MTLCCICEVGNHCLASQDSKLEVIHPWNLEYEDISMFFFAANLTSLAGWLIFMFQLLNLWPVKSFISSPQFCFSTESQSPPFFLAAVRLRALRRTDRHQAWQSHRWSIQKMVKLDQGIRMSSKQRKAANIHLLLGVKGWTSLFSNVSLPPLWPHSQARWAWQWWALPSVLAARSWWKNRETSSDLEPGRNSRAPKSLNTGRVGSQTGDFEKQHLIWIWYEFMLGEWWW